MCAVKASMSTESYWLTHLYLASECRYAANIRLVVDYNPYFSFRHYNAGISVGAADMYLRFEDKLNQNNTIIWNTLYNQGTRWNQVTVQLGRITRPFQIALAKISLGVFDGVSALDDVTFNNCSLPPAVEECPHTHFHCVRTRACVEHSQVCDLVDDCGDGSDEEGCCKCLFCLA